MDPDYDSIPDGGDLVLESKDPVVRRGDLLVRLAAAVDETDNDEARADLLDFMALVIGTIAPSVRRGNVHAIPERKSDGEPDQV